MEGFVSNFECVIYVIGGIALGVGIGFVVAMWLLSDDHSIEPFYYPKEDDNANSAP